MDDVEIRHTFLATGAIHTLELITGLIILHHICGGVNRNDELNFRKV